MPRSIPGLFVTHIQSQGHTFIITAPDTLKGRAATCNQLIQWTRITPLRMCDVAQWVGSLVRTDRATGDVEE